MNDGLRDQEYHAEMQFKKAELQPPILSGMSIAVVLFRAGISAQIVSGRRQFCKLIPGLDIIDRLSCRTGSPTCS